MMLLKVKFVQWLRRLGLQKFVRAVLYVRFRFYKWLRRKELTVLAYHGLTAFPEYGNYDGKFLSLDEFEEQLQFLKREYRIISMQEAIACLRGDSSWPKNSLVITWDDGYENNYYHLKRFVSDVPMTIFVVPGEVESELGCLLGQLAFAVSDTLVDGFDYAGEWFSTQTARDKKKSFLRLSNILRCCEAALQRDFVKSVFSQLQVSLEGSARYRENYASMTWEMMKELSRLGCAFASHGWTHVPADSLSEEMLEDWLRDSRAKLMESGVNYVNALAFPFGRYREEQVEAVFSSGYDCVLSTERGGVSPGARLWRRISLNRSSFDVFLYNVVY